jgi:hypothetical protein
MNFQTGLVVSMSARKTWFLSPDFTFFDDGDIRLGTVLKYPDRPTLALAFLGQETPGITLPHVNIITEPGHTHSTGADRSAGASVFAKFIELASASGSVEASKYKATEFGTVDHEVRLFSRSLTEDALRAVLEIGSVSDFMNSGPFGRLKKRPIYLASHRQNFLLGH